MRSSTHVLAGLLVMAGVFAPLPAQEKAAPKPPADAPPSLKTKEHEALAQQAGGWDLELKITSPSGEPMVAKGRRESKLICNGLWLVSRIEADLDGETLEMHRMLGYDTNKKKYIGAAFSTRSAEASVAEGEADPKADTITMRLERRDPQGTLRKLKVVSRWDEQGRRVETQYLVGDDGKEMVASEMIATRSKGSVKPAEPKVKPVSSKPGANLTPLPEHVAFAAFTGDWSGTFDMTPAPDAPKMPGKVADHSVLVCNGLFVLSEVTGEVGGERFEGRGFIGWDRERKCYAGYWIDNMSTMLSTSTAQLDKAGKVWTADGDGLDMAGKPCKTHEITTFTGPDARTWVMTSVDAAGKAGMAMEGRLTRKRS